MKTEFFALWLCAQFAAIILLVIGWGLGADWFLTAQREAEVSGIFCLQFMLVLGWFLFGKVRI